MQQLWMASVPIEAPYQLIFVEADSWYAAREICRIVYHDESLEEYWRRMRLALPSMLSERDKIYYRDERGEIQMKIVPVIKRKPEKRRTVKKRRKK